VASLQHFTEENHLPQIVAWNKTVPIVQREAVVVLAEEEMAKRFNALLEYELPREGGRRPDLIVLENGVVIVVEFKGRSDILLADVDQVAAYARDLKNYHALTHELEVVPILVPTGYKGPRSTHGEVTVTSPGELGRFLAEQARRMLGDTIDAKAWVDGEYAPLPSLLQAARLIFERMPLPRIKRAESARIPEVVDLVLATCHEAAATKTRHILLLTGVPGSGKTLVGLQVAHSPRLEDLRSRTPGGKNGAPAVFLSGNGPLVEVLHDALANRAFVAGVKKFIDYYRFKRPSLIPSEHVLIFDEAQRAWDAAQMERKHGEAISEPSALLTIAGRIPDWSVVLALVGEGQEIHRGEESGLQGWKDALDGRGSSDGWIVHGASNVAWVSASESRCRFECEDLLNLSTTLRAHLASNLHEWVAQVLQTGGSNLKGIRTLADELRRAGFLIYVTREVELAKRYVVERYSTLRDRRFGLLASRYAKNLRPLGIDNKYHFQRAEQLQVGRWFNAEPSDTLSCCALKRPATEFECQGLELDFPIVCWGDDFLWDVDKWFVNPEQRKTVTDPARVTINAYRVLMTRGRDGVCLFVPRSDDARFDATANLLVAAGGRLMTETISVV
jgi:DUF2075 family protein